MGTQIKVLRRKAITGCATACKIEIDGSLVGQLKNGENISFEVDAGAHKICFLDSMDKVLQRGTFTATEGKAIIVEIQFNGATGQLDVVSEDIVCEAKKKATGAAAAVLLVFAVIIAVCSIFLITDGMNDIFGGGNSQTNQQGGSNNPANTQIEYTPVDIQDLLDELNANALRAEEKYQNKYIEITGKIKLFDSDGKYIAIVPYDASDWSFETVQCYLTDSTHKAFLLEKDVGDVVTIRGKIFSVGEVLGYSLKIAEITD